MGTKMWGPSAPSSLRMGVKCSGGGAAACSRGPAPNLCPARGWFGARGCPDVTEAFPGIVVGWGYYRKGGVAPRFLGVFVAR